MLDPLTMICFLIILGKQEILYEGSGAAMIYSNKIFKQVLLIAAFSAISMLILIGCSEESLNKLDSMFGLESEESPDEKKKPADDIVKKKTSDKKSEAAKKHEALKEPEGVNLKADVFPDSGAGDKLLGWSKDEKFFAIRQEHKAENEYAYSLYSISMGTERMPVKNRPLVYVSTREIDIEGLGWQKRIEATITQFDTASLKHLKPRKITSESNVGKILVDNGFIISRRSDNPDEKIKSEYLEDIELDEGVKARLKVTIKTRDQTAEDGTVTNESAIAVKLTTIGKDQGGNGPSKVLINREGNIFIPGVSAVWLSRVLLAPGGDKVLLILEAFENGVTHSGRWLTGIGYTLGESVGEKKGINRVVTPLKGLKRKTVKKKSKGSKTSKKSKKKKSSKKKKKKKKKNR